MDNVWRHVCKKCNTSFSIDLTSCPKCGTTLGREHIEQAAYVDCYGPLKTENAALRTRVAALEKAGRAALSVFDKLPIYCVTYDMAGPDGVRDDSTIATDVRNFKDQVPLELLDQLRGALDATGASR